jgi:hypothetical protein
VRNVLKVGGKPSDEATVRSIKFKVARIAEARGWDALHEAKVGPLQSLSAALEDKLGPDRV